MLLERVEDMEDVDDDELVRDMARLPLTSGEGAREGEAATASAYDGTRRDETMQKH